MLVLVMGAKGGVGTTTLALHLARVLKGVGLDLYDGQLAARLERTTWSVGQLALMTAAQRRRALERIVKRQVALLWTPECSLAPDASWGLVRAVADRTPVVADGGIEPAAEAVDLADSIVVVSAPDVVAEHHERRLREVFPGAVFVDLAAGYRGEAKRRAREVAAWVLEGP